VAIDSLIDLVHFDYGFTLLHSKLTNVLQEILKREVFFFKRLFDYCLAVFECIMLSNQSDYLLTNGICNLDNLINRIRSQWSNITPWQITLQFKCLLNLLVRCLMDLDIGISSFDLVLGILNRGFDLDLVVVESSVEILYIINGWRRAHHYVLSHYVYFVNHLDTHLVNVLLATCFFELRNWLILGVISWDAKVCFCLRLVLIRLISLWSCIRATYRILNSCYSTTCHRCHTTTKGLSPVKNSSTLRRLILIKYALVHLRSSLRVCYTCLDVTKFRRICLHHRVQEFHQVF